MIRVYKAIESKLFEGEGALQFNWCHGEPAGAGNPYNCVGVPTTLDRHCRSSINFLVPIIYMNKQTENCGKGSLKPD